MTHLDNTTAKALHDLGAVLDSLSKTWPHFFDIEVEVKLSGEPYARWHQEDGETEWFIGEENG